LCRALDAAVCGRGQVVLIAGEPGIGKTTLAREFAAIATMRGARVLWGRTGDREGSPPYWPWTQALRAFIEHETADDLRAFCGSGARYIGIITTEVRESIRVGKRSSVPVEESARFRLADAVRGFFQRAA